MHETSIDSTLRRRIPKLNYHDLGKSRWSAYRTFSQKKNKKKKVIEALLISFWFFLSFNSFSRIPSLFLCNIKSDLWRFPVSGLGPLFDSRSKGVTAPSTSFFFEIIIISFNPREGGGRNITRNWPVVSKGLS